MIKVGSDKTIQLFTGTLLEVILIARHIGTDTNVFWGITIATTVDNCKITENRLNDSNKYYFE